MSDIKAAPLAAFPPPNEVNSRWCFDSSFAPDTALILINSGLGCPAFLRAVWACASLRVAADGAATRLWRTLLRSPASCGACGRCACASGGAAAGAVGSATLSEALAADAGAREVLEAHLPDLVCGDWDSIDAETEAFLRMRGVPCAPQPEDQDSTDLEKCLRAVHDAASRRAPHGGATGAAAQMRVLVYGAFGGRFDQEAQNLNCLYKWSSSFAALTLVSEDALALLLPRGVSRVHVAAPFEGPCCGLVPLGQPVHSLTTHGLHWDVSEWDTRFGGRVSTSNRVEGWGGDELPVVTIDASAPILWTASVDARAVTAAASAAARV